MKHNFRRSCLLHHDEFVRNVSVDAIALDQLCLVSMCVVQQCILISVEILLLLRTGLGITLQMYILFKQSLLTYKHCMLHIV